MECMTGDSLHAQIAWELEIAGLRPYSHDESRAGGFGIQEIENGVHVVWTPSGRLSDSALGEMQGGSGKRSEMLHLGRVKNAMADAILHILVSRGMDARMSSDDMLPATVEVFIRGAN